MYQRLQEEARRAAKEKDEGMEANIIISSSTSSSLFY